MFKTRLCAAALITTLGLGAGVPTIALADGAFDNQLKARQGQFRLIALNLGVLGGMARGDVPYDAETAQAAADNLVTVAALNQAVMWPEGSDFMSIEGTRATPSIWENNADFVAKWEAVGTAAAGLAAVASDGQAAIGPAMGPMGATCKACHEAHRTPDE